MSRIDLPGGGFCIERFMWAKGKTASGSERGVMPRLWTSIAAGVLVGLQLVRPLRADPVPVVYPEGTVRGYLAMRTLDGKLVASGDLFQSVKGGLLTSRLVYHFKDGSLDDDTAVFTQHGRFQLIREHRIQRGPMFPHPVDLRIDAGSGEVTVQPLDKADGKVTTEHMDLPPDLANGILLDLVKSLVNEQGETRVAYLATTPKPRLIHLVIRRDGEDRFLSAGAPNKAVRLSIHVDIGGVRGVIAPVIGKEPPDTHVWLSKGVLPAYIISEQPLYLGGPVLRTELVTPVWR